MTYPPSNLWKEQEKKSKTAIEVCSIKTYTKYGGISKWENVAGWQALLRCDLFLYKEFYQLKADVVSTLNTVNNYFN